MTPEQLKNKIFQLLDDLLVLRQSRSYWAEQAYYGMPTYKLKSIEKDIEDIKQQGREAIFDLMISGISHREFLKFVESYE